MEEMNQSTDESYSAANEFSSDNFDETVILKLNHEKNGVENDISDPVNSNEDVNEVVDVRPITKQCYVALPPFPSEYLSLLSFKEHVVTEEEIAESLKKKEEIDSLDGSYFSGSISQISGSLKASKIDSSLEALMLKKNQLIASLKSMFTSSSDLNSKTIPENSLSDTETNSMDATLINQKPTPIIATSIPFRESKPPVARFLKKWNPTFFNGEKQEDKMGNFEVEDEDNGYEKAMASLKEVLDDTKADTASKLDSYGLMLDAFKEEDDKKFQEMLTSISLKRNNLDEVLEEFPEQDKINSSNESVVWVDSQDKTIVVNDTSSLEETKKQAPEESLTSITDDSPNKTLTESDTSKNKLKLLNIEISVPRLPFPLKSPEETVKESDPETDVLIIADDDDFIFDIDDEEQLLASDNEEKKIEDVKKSQFPPSFSKELELFISTDPDENRDNNDPKWNSFRNLENDYERYKVVQARWRNLEIPNPKRDLTCRCRKSFYRRNGRTTYYNNINNNNDYGKQSRKRPHSPDTSAYKSKKSRKESCTMIFDRSIDKLAHDMQLRRTILQNQQKETLKHISDIHAMESMLLLQKNPSKQELANMKERHFQEMEDCVRQYRRSIAEVMEAADAELMALRKASDEVRQFHEFYPIENGNKDGKDSLTLLTDTEVQEILEVEEMVLSFTSFYNA